MSNLLRPYNERMMEVLLYIQENLDEDLSPETLAEVACFSVAHFHRIFKGMVGESLKEHVRRLRLERAAYKLSYSDKSVMDIALDARFESSETFSRAFKKMFKIPPSEYRIQFRKLATPDGNGKIRYQPAPDSNEFKLVGSPLTYEVEVRKRDETQVAFIRHVGSYFDVTKAWNKLCSWAFKRDILNSETEYLGLCYDDPYVTPQGKIRYDACISFGDEIEPHPEIGTQIIPCGKYAVATHYGPYDGLMAAYQELYGKWLPASGYQLKNNLVSFEKYVNTPEKTAPEDLITEIWLGIY
ncbi:AraC family transcriptional regulator [Maridesulfovibrio hydrothermalis]|uniref:Transcriptional regulator, AraC family n=1 Tax=Maridesulfovibrio hydrothermalis AM13 = DSM 14728 TaxID=1121451 RepID=L0RBC2_9BACT|nr:AraC family transcriptional regulator [Maridesulfovibrio hydrothermalis]CCO24088.1 Transcriptional regulator, AraC family [Maridesulfovibrio hydrothermalis AM13 = DSM 14728]